VFSARQCASDRIDRTAGGELSLRSFMKVLPPASSSIEEKDTPRSVFKERSTVYFERPDSIALQCYRGDYYYTPLEVSLAGG
jgi:hypothetical protein